MFNLLSQLTTEDRAKIENYIHLYGTLENFIGIDEWLSSWSKEKIKLFKLLNNQLILKTPFSYERPDRELERELRNLVDSCSLTGHYYDIIDSLEIHNLIDNDTHYNLGDILYWKTFFDNKIAKKVKIKFPDAKKELQLQAGTKPVRALTQFVNYLIANKEIVEKACGEGKLDQLSKSLSEFQTTHSIIFNDKVIHGNLVLSIHPLDFMTMSDNASNWQSCMNWIEDGCYHTGTVEMMNSNNVLCCYLEASTPFNFSKREKIQDDPNYLWNNKRWRQLIYVTKDIIVSGKPYPYANNDMTKVLIEKVRELAKQNLKWEYAFGIEQYQDMKWINSIYSMNRARDFRAAQKSKVYKDPHPKHNILFDTKGMYNDMLNDSNTKYWCVRNKVKKTTIISYSGKAPCLCCGESVLIFNDDECDDYNSRYSNTDAVICDACDKKYFWCECCNSTNHRIKHYHYFETEADKENNNFKIICEECFKNVGKCPVCGEYMFASESKGIFIPVSPDGTFNEKELEFRNYYQYFWKTEEFEALFDTLRPVCMHRDCAKKIGGTEHTHSWTIQDIYWRNTDTNNIILLPYTEGSEEWLKSKVCTIEPTNDLVISKYKEYWY